MAYLSRSLWSAAGILAVGAGVGLYAYYGTYQGALEEDKRRVEEARLFRFDPGQVAGGEVTAKGGTVRFARSTQGWFLTSPVEALADPGAVQLLIAEMAGLRTVTTIELTARGPEKLGTRYGLEEPLVKVILHLDGGEKVELRVGLKSDFDGRYYVQNPALSTIGLAEPGFLRNVERDHYALRDKRVIILDPHEVQTVEVAQGNKTLYSLARRSDGWDLVGPPPVLADPVEVVRLVEELRDLRAKSFADDSGSTDPGLQARFGLDARSFVVTLGLTADRRLALRIGGARLDGESTRWFAKADGSRAIVEIDPTFYKDLDRTPLDFQNLRVIDVDKDAVERVRIESGAEVIEVARAASDAGMEGWQLTSPKAGAAASYKVSALIYALASLKAKRIDTNGPEAPELRRAGLAPPKSVVTLFGAGQKILATLWVGDRSPQHETERYAMAKGGARIDIVDLEKIGLPKSGDELLDTAAAPAADAN